jgi:hypothetical protein
LVGDLLLELGCLGLGIGQVGFQGRQLRRLLAGRQSKSFQRLVERRRGGGGGLGVGTIGARLGLALFW